MEVVAAAGRVGRPSPHGHRPVGAHTEAVDWEIDFVEAPPVIVVRTSGQPTVAGFAVLRDEVLDHPSFFPGIDVVYDHTGLTGYLTSGEIRSVAEAAARAARERDYWGRLAIIMPDPAMFGLARMWEAYAGDDLAARTRVFTSVDEAYRWLGATPPSP